MVVGFEVVVDVVVEAEEEVREEAQLACAFATGERLHVEVVDTESEVPWLHAIRQHGREEVYSLYLRGLNLLAAKWVGKEFGSLCHGQGHNHVIVEVGEVEAEAGEEAEAEGLH